MRRRGCHATVVLCAFAVSACAGRQSAAPSRLPELSEIREYAVPWENAFPNDVALDSAGRVWFTDRLTHAIGMFDPATEQFTRYETPTKRSAPYGIAAAPDGGIWFAESVAQRIARIDPATGTIVEHVIDGSTKGPNLLAIRDGLIWFSLRDESAYGSFDMRTHETRTFRAERARPYGVSIARDGTVWFSGGGLRAVDPRTGEATRYDLTANVVVPPDLMPNLPEAQRRSIAASRVMGEIRRIATDRAGNVWLADYGRGQALRYSPATGDLARFPTLHTAARAYGITISAAGHVWYGEAGTGQIVVLDPVTEERKRVNIPTSGAVVRHLIVDDRRGRVWLPMSDGGKLGLIEFPTTKTK